MSRRRWRLRTEDGCAQAECAPQALGVESLIRAREMIADIRSLALVRSLTLLLATPFDTWAYSRIMQSSLRSLPRCQQAQDALRLPAVDK